MTIPKKDRDFKISVNDYTFRENSFGKQPELCKYYK